MAVTSPKPLAEKLGLHPGDRLALLNPPQEYLQALGDWWTQVELHTDLEGPLDFIHFFSRQQAELASAFPRLKQALAYDGLLWISWPKKSSGLATDLNENRIREMGLAHGLVDVKVAAIDERWSGLKFVYRLKDRR